MSIRCSLPCRRTTCSTIDPSIDTRPPPARESRPPDYSMADGHFFTQGSGRPVDRDPSGFAVTNADGLGFWDAWQLLGSDQVGLPISRRFAWGGVPTQVFQKAVLQGRGADGLRD